MSVTEKLGIIMMVAGVYFRAIDINPSFNIIANVVLVVGLLILTYESKS